MIEIRHITKCFDEVKALSDVLFSIPEGKVFGLLGTNGAGKTTLLRTIAGILECDEGEILIDGEKLSDSPEIKKKFFYLPDDPYYFAGATLEQTADFYARQYPDMEREKVSYMAEKLNLDGKRPIRTFSKGMKRQAFLILALCTNTEYLLCDEVFDGLDPMVTEVMKNLFRSKMEDGKLTVVVAAHKLQDLEDFCDDIGILHKGGMLLAGDMRKRAGRIHKIQCVFAKKQDADTSKEDRGMEERIREKLDILRYREEGYFTTILVRGKSSKIQEEIEKFAPIFWGEVPMTLEEIFVAEMEAGGYDIQRVLQ
ncbi:MAG: ABC transporter ATP-binding protein [Coprococcus sp.]|nr:ABC transporter ATP-binding protein [Coprococcus sp.]